MFYYSRSNRQGVLFLALAFLLIQFYVLYSSTSHVFHSSMPMCPICVAIKSYQGGDIDSATTTLSIIRFHIFIEFIPSQWVKADWFNYDSRAPPLSLSK